MLRANEVIGIDLGTTNSCVAVMEGKVGRARRSRSCAQLLLVDAFPSGLADGPIPTWAWVALCSSRTCQPTTSGTALQQLGRTTIAAARCKWATCS